MAANELGTATTALLRPQLQRLQQLALVLGGVGLVLTGIGAVQDMRGLFQSYLFAYLFWLGVTVGSLALLMLHHTVGGGWGYVIRRMVEAGSRLLPLLFVLFVPVLVGLFSFGLFPWTDPQIAEIPAVHAKLKYLNPPFFIVRWVLYFAIWTTFAWQLNRLGATQDQRADRNVAAALNVRWGAFGMVVYVLSISFAAVDWMLSLDPTWASSIVGLLTVVSQVLSTLALMLALIGYFGKDSALIRQVPAGFYRDLGNLTLATVMLWAYMSFSQYLITYSGNTAEEVGWYLRRSQGGWQYISLALIPLHFFLPFFILLLGSNVKQNPRRLGAVGLGLVVMRLVDLFWWVAPNFREHVAVIGSDFGAPLLLGGVWLWLWAAEMMKERTLVPAHDPRLAGHWPAAAEAHHG